MSKTTKARKGDLILVEEVTVNHYSVAARTEAEQAGKPLPDRTTSYRFGVVDSATRDGQVKTWRQVGFGDELISVGYAQPIRHHRRWVMPAKQTDVTAVLTAAKAHHYDGHPGQPKPFDSFAEAQAVARPHLLVAERAPVVVE